MSPEKRGSKRTPSVQVSYLQHRRPITFSFLARHAKSSALLGRSVCTAGPTRRRPSRGGRGAPSPPRQNYNGLMPRQIFNGLMPRQIFNGLMPRQKRRTNRARCVRVEQRGVAGAVCLAFLARHAKSSALSGPPPLWVQGQEGGRKAPKNSGGSDPPEFSAPFCSPAGLEPTQGEGQKGLRILRVAKRNARRIVLDRRRCDTWKDRGRFACRFSRDSQNPQPFWDSSDVQRAPPEGVRPGGRGAPSPPRQNHNGLMPRQIFNGLMPRQKRRTNRARCVRVEQLGVAGAVCLAFLARHAKSSALLGRSVCTAGRSRRRPSRGGGGRPHPQGRITTGLCQGIFITGLCQGRFTTGLCQGRNARVNGRGRRRCHTCADRGRFACRLSRVKQNPQPFWDSSDVQRAPPEGVRPEGGGGRPHPQDRIITGLCQGRFSTGLCQGRFPTGLCQGRFPTGLCQGRNEEQTAPGACGWSNWG